ncbi:MAG: coenzyme F420-0:L-glutamate ligase [Deltaproteobacteria bacterium]|nr:coenzyme F420-0:L-glutamate ligase [Deltaproteobacteria bacterium]
MRPGISLIPVRFSGEIRPGDDLFEKLSLALRHQKVSLEEGDVLIIKHKIVSKAEGRFVDLNGIKPSADAQAWAKQGRLDARVIELVLRESRRIVRQQKIGRRPLLITETHHGLVCANSGIDLSNVDGGKHALLLPQDPDRSALRLYSTIKKKCGIHVAVIISDSFGRPWREGLTEVAIGVAGVKPLIDLRGKRDPYGYRLHATSEAVADELACAAGLLCGKLNRTPACIVRGYRSGGRTGSARQLIRAQAHDLFR